MPHDGVFVARLSLHFCLVALTNRIHFQISGMNGCRPVEVNDDDDDDEINDDDDDDEMVLMMILHC